MAKKERIRCFHRFSYLGKGETILYEPKEGHFIWLVMYIPPRHRGNGISDFIFRYAVNTLSGVHHIHCSKRIRTFKQLARRHRWKYVGRSRYIVGCSSFRFEHSTKRKLSDGIAVTYEILVRVPRLQTFTNSAHGNYVVGAINEDLANLD